MELVPSVSFTTAYDDNIFTVQEGSGDAMMLVTPAFEAFYESPKTSLRGLYTFDMQRAVGYSTLNSLDAKRHAMINTGFQISPQFRLSLIGRYDVSDRPGDLMFDTGVLLGRQRARRYQVTPAIAFRIRPRTTILAQYDATKEALGADMRGDMFIARVGVSRMQTTRDVWSVNYLGRTFANGPDMFKPAATERSHTVLFGYNRAVGVGTNFSVQGGPRVSSYGNDKPELLANFTKQVRAGRFGFDYWLGETIIMGIRGPVDIQSFSMKSAWPIRRNIEFGAHAGVFNSREDGPPEDQRALASIQRSSHPALANLPQFAAANNPLNLIPRVSWGNFQSSGSAVRWSNGASKNPWIWPVWRSTDMQRSAPAARYRLARSRPCDRDLGSSGY